MGVNVRICAADINVLLQRHVYYGVGYCIKVVCDYM